MVLMAVRRRDTNLCCNFLKPEHAGARHWKILWLWSQVGLLDPAQFLTDKQCYLPGLCAAPVAALMDNPLTTSSL